MDHTVGNGYANTARISCISRDLEAGIVSAVLAVFEELKNLNDLLESVVRPTDAPNERVVQIDGRV